MLSEISRGSPGMGKSNRRAGNTWRGDVAEKDLGIKMDHKLDMRHQQEAFVVENPKTEPEPSLHWGCINRNIASMQFN